MQTEKMRRFSGKDVLKMLEGNKIWEAEDVPSLRRTPRKIKSLNKSPRSERKPARKEQENSPKKDVTLKAFYGKNEKKNNSVKKSKETKSSADEYLFSPEEKIKQSKNKQVKSAKKKNQRKKTLQSHSKAPEKSPVDTDSPASDKKFFKSRSVPLTQRQNSSGVVVNKGFKLKFNPRKVTWNSERKHRSPLKIHKRKCVSESDQPTKKAKKLAYSDGVAMSPDLLTDSSQNAESADSTAVNVSKDSGIPDGTVDDRFETESIHSTMFDEVCLLSLTGSEKSDLSKELKSVSDTKDEGKTNNGVASTPKVQSAIASYFLRTPKMSPNVVLKNAKKSPQRGSPKLFKKTVDEDGREQMTLDFGQKIVGTIQCQLCGMAYSVGEPEDEATHSKYHQRTLVALKFPGWKKERVVQEFLDGSRILLVLPDEKVEKIDAVRKVMDEDLGFCENATKANSKIFLYISKDKKVIGCCIVDSISQGYRTIIQEDNHPDRTGQRRPWCCNTEPEPAKCGINRIWVLRAERRKGIASKLVDAARMNFTVGFPLAKEQMAFSDPTPDGRQFARKYMESASYLIYKCN